MDAKVNEISRESILAFIDPDTDTEEMRALEEEVLKGTA